MLIILIVVLSSPAGWPPLAAAQAQARVKLSARAGYDNSYRQNEWFAVAVDLSNDGPDINGMLAWTFATQDHDQSFQQRIELPSGAHKRVLIDVLANGYGRNGLVRLLDGGTELARQEITLEAFDESVFLTGVVSSDAALLNQLEAQQIGTYSTSRVRHIDLFGLPEAAAELRGLNTLFLHDIDSAALSPGQRGAIELWVSQGGQLVVSGGLNAQKTTAGLIDLLPIQSLGPIGQGDLAPLAQLAGGSQAALPANAAISSAQPRPGAEPLPANSALLYRWRYGAGEVIFTSFDLASLRGWPGEGELWGPLLIRQAASSYAGTSLSQINLLDRGVLKLPSLHLPSTFTILLFLLIYMLAIGPINYLVLRRMRRLELAWVTIPLIVLGFSAGLYLIGLAVRGGQPQLNQVAVVQGAEGHTNGAATAFIGLFSPSRGSYLLGFPAATLVSGGSSRLFSNNPASTIVADQAGARSVDLLADIASVSTFVAETQISLPAGIESELAFDGAGLQGQIRNSGASTLEDVVLVRGDQFAELGTLAPGASQTITRANMRQSFPSGLALSDSTVFDRQEMIQLLFDPSTVRFQASGALSNGQLNPQDVYLLGWIKQPAIDVAINGQAATQDALSLYIIRLQPKPGR